MEGHLTGQEVGLVRKNKSATPTSGTTTSNSIRSNSAMPEVIVVSSDEDSEYEEDGARHSSEESAFVNRRHTTHHTITDNEDEDEEDADYVETPVVNVLDEDDSRTSMNHATSAPAQTADEEDDDDIVVLNTTSIPRRAASAAPGNSRRRSEVADTSRNMRRRIADSDIEILDERRLPPSAAFTRHHPPSDEDIFRRHILSQRNNRLNPRERWEHRLIHEELVRINEDILQGELDGSIMTRGRLRNSQLTFLQGILGPPYDGHDQRMSSDAGDEIEASILARIERDNENRLDTRLQSEHIFNRKTLLDKKKVSANELKGYTNSISPETHICCELCGVTLGEGIPEDFKPNPKYDLELAKYQKEYNVLAPWFCFKECTGVDIDLSKRIFVAKCGHVYCGRCFKNIGSRVPIRRRRNQESSIVNPRVFSPRSCVASECESSFRGKTPFTEVFF